MPNVPARVAATECGNTRGNIEVATACNHHGGRQDFDSETFIAYGLELSNQGSGRNVGWYPASAPSRTLDTNGPPGVMGPQPLYYSHDYNQDRIYSPDGPAPAVTSQDSNGSRNVLAAMQVRRLTPMECERLQGFPDQWTRWDADGKEQSDSARYRQLGNAVCVPVAEWIGRRIMERP